MQRKISLVLLTATTALCADGPECCPEIIEDCCECSVCPPSEEITPKAGPCVKDSNDLYLTADFIYWTAHEENLEFASTESIKGAIGERVKGPKNKVYQPHTNWRPGFKVGAGYDFCFDGWDVFAEYTWYHTTTKRSTSENLSSVFLLDDSYWFVNNPTLSVSTVTSQVLTSLLLPGSFANEKWHLSFNVIDLELGRNFYISRRIMFRPYFGLKGTWQTQNLNVAFQGVQTSDTTSFVIFSMSNKMNNWGIGILAGVNGSWHLTRNFSLIGNIALSGLWQHFSIERVDFASFPRSNAFVNFINLSNNFYKLTPVIEWVLGFRWETWFACDTYHFAFDAGWEMQNWFSQNKFIRVPGSPKCDGDLALQGLTLKARFDF